MNWQEFRQQFPVTSEASYLLSSRRGPMPKVVAERLDALNRDHMQCPAQAIYEWRESERPLAENAASYFGANVNEITWVPSATAGVSLVANGFAWQAGDEIVIPGQEYPGNVYPWMQLERYGVTLRKVEPDASGRVTAEMLLEAIGPRTRLVSASHVSFVHGYRIDAAKLAQGCRERRVFSVIDAAQSCGWCDIDFRAIGCDVLVGLVHKFFCCPDGIGIFLIREDAMSKIAPSVPGKVSVKQWADMLDHRLDYWDHAWRYSGGSLATPQMYALDTVMQFFASVGKSAIEERCLSLAGYAREQFSSHGIECVGNDWEKSEQSVVVTTPVKLEDASERLAEAKVYTSVNASGVRIGVHAFNNEQDIDRLVAVLTA